MKPNLIVMLTHRDRTVLNAAEVFEQCRNAEVLYWGMKEAGLPLSQMKPLFAHMKACGKKTALEVVAYTEQECMAGARMAAECGCDLLMGTRYFDSVCEFCRNNGLKYLPFVGAVEGRPSVLNGSAEEMIAEAQSYLQRGVFGIDLLGYRYVGDAAALNRALVEAVDAPICIAGSINSYRRLDEVLRAAPWGFTIGGAFFEHCFGDDLCDQINAVCRYIEDGERTLNETSCLC